MNRKYVAFLAVAAALILVAGVALRPREVTTKGRSQASPAAAQQAPPPAPSRRGQMRQISEFLAERANDSARHVVFLQDEGKSGVVLGSGVVVTDSAEGSGFVVAADQPPAGALPANMAPEAEIGQSGGWVFVVGRNRQGEAIHASGIRGGATDAQCGLHRVRKLLLNIPLDATYAGAGVFDINGNLLGVVATCGGSWMAVAGPSVVQELEAQHGADAAAWRGFGVRTAAPTEDERRVLRLAPGGLFVTEVRVNSTAAAIGIRPGDQLLASGDRALEKPEDLVALGSTIRARREGRMLTLPTDPPFALEAVDTSPVLSAVREDSRLYEAGLRPGDRILRLDGLQDPTPSQIARVLARKAPAYAIYERAGRRIGAVMP